MLRRKLMMTLGSLVVLLVLAGVVAVTMLHGLLDELTSASAAALQRTAASTAAAAALGAVESGLRETDGGGEDLNLALRALEARLAELDTLDRSGGLRVPELRGLEHRGEELRALVERLAAAAPGHRAEDRDAALLICAGLRQTLAALDRMAQGHAEEELLRTSLRFRWTVLGLGLAFVLLINVAILVLIWAATMILRPVDRLVEASRHLAREQFDHRVRIDQRDEFGELAGATNRMAEQLQRNEERKIETLHQVSRTLNHELNNALAIIDTQLHLVTRSAEGTPEQEGRLGQIHLALERMRDTVAALRHVRRIVLTDYVEGVKMLDLERSVQDAPAPGATTPPGTA
jgi:nitrate/nitrite-specific signal transduction histidine kinase